MRPTPDSVSYKRFLGSPFLSDFTLIISVEGQEPPKLAPVACNGDSSEPGQVSDTLLLGQDTYATPESSPRKLEAEQPEAADFTALSDQATSGLAAASDGSGSGALSPGLLAKACSLRVGSGSAFNTTHTKQQQQQHLNGHHHHHQQQQQYFDDGGSCCVMPVHGIVLAAASPFFETLLRDWKGNLQHQIRMVVEEDQVQAAKTLITFMYTSSIPQATPQQDLLNLVLLADKYDVRQALEAAGQSLGSLSAAALDWPTLLAITSLPDHLYESDALAGARAVAAERLQQLFSDLEATWATGDGRAKWRQLPVRAVLLLAASDALALANENTLFAALASWVATSGATATAEELQLLAAAVRLPYVTPGYLSFVVMQHAWFRAAVDPVVLARAAAFAAASPDVRKDLMSYTATALTSSTAAAAAAGGGGGAAAAAAGRPPVMPIVAPAAPAGVVPPLPCTHHHAHLVAAYNAAGGGGGGNGSTPGATNGANTYSGPAGSFGGGSASGGSSNPALYASLVAGQQRPRTSSSVPRAHTFTWLVDLAAVEQLYQEVAAAGSRDSRLLRSPAHFHGGYEWALQLEVTQTKGATGFDGSKPWALGVFLTCQVRAEVPVSGGVGVGGSSSAGTSSSSNIAGGCCSRCGAAGAASAAAVGGGGVDQGQAGCACSRCGGGAAGRTDTPDAADAPARQLAPILTCSSGGISSSMCRACGAKLGSGGTSNLARSGSSSCQGCQQQDGAAAHHDLAAAAAAASRPVQVQQLDFGIVATAATISAKEAAGGRRWEKSWEHGVVRRGASWGWPNYLDVTANGWEDSVFERWNIDGQLHLQCQVRVLG